MAAATSTTYDALLRELWPQDDVFDLLYENNAFFATCPKDTSFYEKIRHVALGYGTTQGVGADFTSAKANKSGGVNAEFKVTPVTYYSLFSIQRQLLRRAGNKKAAILPALERESRLGLLAWKRDISYLIFGNGGGAIGRLKSSSSISGATFTLETLNDVRHFEQNMVLQMSADDGTGGAGVHSGTVKVASVARDTGVITCTGNVTAGISSATDHDYVFRQGNYNAVCSGLAAWVPSSAPSATTFFGLDRTKDTLRLGGIRVTATGLAPRQAAMKAAKEVYVNGGKPTHYFISPDDYLNLQLELTSAGTLQMTKEPGAPIGKYTFGAPFEAISLMGPAGLIKVMPDINCPVSTGYMLQLDTWTLGTMGDAPYFDMEDGNRILRESDADSYEGRIVGDFQLWCEAPGYNAAVAL